MIHETLLETHAKRQVFEAAEKTEKAGLGLWRGEVAWPARRLAFAFGIKLTPGGRHGRLPP